MQVRVPPPVASERWMHPSLVLLVFASFVAVDPWGWDAFGPLRFALVSTAGVGLVAAVLGRAHVVVRRPTLAMGVLVAWLAVAAVFGVDALYAWIGTPDRHLGVVTWLLFLGAFVFGQHLVSAGHQRVLELALVAGGGLAALYATIELVGWSPVDVSFADDRVGGPFGQPAYLGAAMVLTLPVAAVLALRSDRDRRLRVLSAVVVVLAVVALLASQTRGAWIGAAVASGVAAWRARDMLRARPQVAAMVGAGGLAVLVLLAVVTPLGGRATSAFDLGAGTSQGRVDEWRTGLAALADRPVLGAGPEGYRVVFAEAVDATYEQRHGRAVLPDRAHNGLLDVGLAGGFPALLLYAVLLALVVGAALRAPPRLLGFGLAVVGHAVQQLFLFPLAELDVVFWVVAGVVVIATSVEGDWSVVGTPRWSRWPAVALAAAVLAVGLLDVAADHRTASAVDASAAGDQQRAEDAADDAIALRPDSIRYRFIAARLANRRGDLAGIDAALGHIADGLGISPDDPALRRERAALLVDRSLTTGDPADTAAASATLAELVADDPNNAGYRLQRGVMLAAAGDPGAEGEFRRAAELAPDSAAPLVNLTLLLAGQGRLDDAAEAAALATSREPDDPAVQQLAEVLERAGQG